MFFFVIGSVSLFFFFFNFFDTGRALFLKMFFNIFGEKTSWQPCAFLNNKINTETKAKCPEKHNYGINIFSNVMYLKLYRQKNLICLMISSLMISRFVSFSFTVIMCIKIFIQKRQIIPSFSLLGHQNIHI